VVSVAINIEMPVVWQVLLLLVVHRLAPFRLP